MVLGSRTDFSPVKAGDALPCAASSLPGRSLAWGEVESPGPVSLRCLPGPQADWFDRSFFTHLYRVTPAADRKNSETAFQLPAAILAGLLFAVVVFVIYDTSWRVTTRAAYPATAASLGEAFLKPFVVPFEIASVLLLTAMVGAIVLTKEEDGEGADA